MGKCRKTNLGVDLNDSLLRVRCGYRRSDFQCFRLALDARGEKLDVPEKSLPLLSPLKRIIRNAIRSLPARLSPQRRLLSVILDPFVSFSREESHLHGQDWQLVLSRKWAPSLHAAGQSL
jgi:hypothetical protein